MKKKGIAYLINQYPMVSHTFIRREIHALERMGFDVMRISLQGWDSTLKDEQDIQERKLTRFVLKEGLSALLFSSIKILFTTPGRFLAALRLAIFMRNGSRRSLPYHLIYLAEACKIAEWMKLSDVNHVHAHFASNSAEVAMLVSAINKKPYSFTVHGQNELLFGGIDEKIRRADFVVAISSYGRSQLYRKVEHAHWQKIKVVHCGIEQEFYDSPVSEISASPSLVCVGRLTEEKGQLLLVEAVKQLANQGFEFKLVLAGDGDMRPDIESLIKKYQLENHINITGWLSSKQVREAILAANAMILPSFSEGLPVVIMEAMALRKPVLSTYVAGIPELVIPGKTGWLFPAGSIDALTEAIKDLLSKSQTELEEMGHAAYSRVLERHSVEIEAAKLARLFDQSVKTYTSQTKG